MHFTIQQEIEDRYVKQMKICEANNRTHVMYLLRLLFCMTFTPKLFKLKLPSLDINCLPALYTDNIKYLEYYIYNNNDYAEMLRQMGLLYCRSNRLVRLFSKQWCI